MKKVKGIVITVLIAALLAGAVWVYFGFQNWTKRFATELDRFFGEESWECVEEESRLSHMYTEYYRSRDGMYSEEVPGRYKNWDILFTKKNGEPEIWTITNHTWKINNDKYWIFSSKRYSARQALVLELMDISHGLVCDKLWEEQVAASLSESEADAVQIVMMYHGGNPKPEFYDKLWKEEWFNSSDATVEHYLTSELHEFYLYIRVHDYKMEKLTEEERGNVKECLQQIEQVLVEKYGPDCCEVYSGK